MPSLMDVKAAYATIYHLSHIAFAYFWDYVTASKNHETLSPIYSCSCGHACIDRLPAITDFLY